MQPRYYSAKGIFLLYLYFFFFFADRAKTKV